MYYKIPTVQLLSFKHFLVQWLRSYQMCLHLQYILSKSCAWWGLEGLNVVVSKTNKVFKCLSYGLHILDIIPTITAVASYIKNNSTKEVPMFVCTRPKPEP